jgi:nitroreductase
MGGFDPDAARKAFGVPEDYIFGAVIALGYQDEPSALPNEQFRSQETAPRQRKPLKDFVFSAWDTPADIG